MVGSSDCLLFRSESRFRCWRSTQYIFYTVFIGTFFTIFHFFSLLSVAETEPKPKRPYCVKETFGFPRRPFRTSSRRNTVVNKPVKTKKPYGLNPQKTERFRGPSRDRFAITYFRFNLNVLNGIFAIFRKRRCYKFKL